MADEWRELALAVPATLMLAGTSREAIDWLWHAEHKLSQTAKVQRMLHDAGGGEPDDVAMAGGLVDVAPHGDCPPCMLEKARVVISRHAAVHAMADHVLADHYAARVVGLRRDDPLCQSWEEHRTAAFTFADQATGRIRAALSAARTVADAGAVANELPPGTPIWRRWMLSTVHLMNTASNEAFLAMQLVRLMNHAVALQFFDAWMILKRQAGA